MRWQNPENRNMGVTTLAYWADALQQICPTGASTLPMMGKHVAPLGQAACPFHEVFGLNPNRSLGLAWILFF